jgi:acyl-CoA synthetase (AMP-forming)/AMP-acid ligase II
MRRNTLAELFEDPRAASPAIISLAPAAAISYRDLADCLEQIGSQLAASGLNPGDCVAISLPNGVEFIALFLAVTWARMVAAPLNPAYKTDELRAAITDLGARAIIAHGDATVAMEVASASVPLWPSNVDSVGKVTLEGVPRASRARNDGAEPGDVAILVRTSGTTGRPKVVPLTHANVTISARAIAAHYGLNPDDRSLAVMPLFHGHGLIGAALSTLASGGTVIVPPRFSASAFWASFVEHRATWYTAVPTIHQVLLARADSDRAPFGGPRFIRSCSAPLAPVVLANLEKRFGAPVIEAYGMTESAHQAASNPLPPRAHKPGTVGFGTGVEIAIIDEAGEHLPANHAGEVAVRGAQVMSGYRDNPKANAESFIDGWFRTGDLGVLDSDGYLQLTGRIKELINRGGEKISPFEIEAVLQQNPAVAEASVFGMPDPKYGEVVWAAVVPKGDADPNRLEAFCKERLAEFKVPKQIRLVSALPKNATGKVVRRDVAALFKAENQ